MSEEAIFRAINDVQARYSNISELIKKLGTQIQENDERLDRAAEHKDKQNKILDSLKESFEKCIRMSQDSHTHLSNEIEKLKVENKGWYALCELFQKRFYDDECEINALKEQLNSFTEHFANSLEQKIFTLRAELEEVIACLPKPQIPSKEDISAAIRLQVEPVAIDAKNGCLRSANCDMRLSIVEKKIDQIFLLLQKHSLNQ